jgi:hypothetical protein
LPGLAASVKIAPTTPDGDTPWNLETAVTPKFAGDVAQVLAEFGLMHMQAATNGTSAAEE